MAGNRPVKVFVYGTLMKGRGNHYLLDGRIFIGQGSLQGYGMYQVRSYPGIVPEPGGSILGEVYGIDPDTMKRLDRLEGEGYLYKRVAEKVTVDGAVHEAFVYVWLGSIEGCKKVSLGEMPWTPSKVGCAI